MANINIIQVPFINLLPKHIISMFKFFCIPITIHLVIPMHIHYILTEDWQGYRHYSQSFMTLTLRVTIPLGIVISTWPVAKDKLK